MSPTARPVAALRASAIVVSLLICIGAGAVTRQLTPHTAMYEIEISVLGGTLTTVVSAAGPGYMVNSVIKPAGLSRLVAHGAIQESSFFVTDDTGVQPRQYRSIDTLATTDKYVSFDFDWRDKLVTGMVDDEEFRAVLNGRVHDRVSIQYQLMFDLLNGGASQQYSLLDGDELKHLVVKNVGKRTIKVPFGEFEAVGIQHRKEDSSRVTTLWCVEELDFLPALIEQHRDGKLVVRAALAEYEPTAATERHAAD
jgi:hypothetical protein